MASRSRKPFQIVPGTSCDPVVLDDLPGMTVSEAELDAVEAFLMAAFRDLVAKDWEPAQSHAEITTIPERRRRRP
jgi:hypothetical protein